MKISKRVILASTAGTYIVLAVAVALILRSAIIPTDDPVRAKADTQGKETPKETRKTIPPPVATVTVRQNGKETTYRVANPGAGNDR